MTRAILEDCFEMDVVRCAMAQELRVRAGAALLKQEDLVD
jgi:hypothetical protein